MGIERIRAIQDFDRARARAFWRALASLLPGRATRLRSIEPLLRAAGLEGRAFGGVREIPVDRIVGSVAPEGKASDFDPEFLPVNRRMRERWTRIYLAMVEGDELPPIDGHHRVSVARNLGRPTINARVIDIKTRAPLDPDVDPEKLLRAAEYAAFLEATQLHRSRPQARLECSRLGRYDVILTHILGHGYFMTLQLHRPVPVQEAAASWYDHVYHPIAEAIREHRVLDQLPGWTEADVYVEVTRRWLAMSAKGEPAGPDPAIESLLREQHRTWWQRRRNIQIPERRIRERRG